MTDILTPPSTLTTPSQRPPLDALSALPLSEHIYFAGGALKGFDDGTVGGYLVVFTGPEDRDSWKEFFTEKTNYWLDWYKSQPILYHHGQNDEAPIPIGIITSITKDAYGLYARGMLDINHDDLNIRYYARRALEQVNKGQLYWSSGSISHMVRVTENGEIVEWPIGEGSLTPKPAETRGRTQVNVLRAAMKSLLDEYPTPDEHPAPSAPPNPEDTASSRLPEPSAKESLPARVSTTRKLARGKPMSTVKMDSVAILAALDNVATLDDATKLAIIREMAAAEQGEEVMEGEGPAMNAAPPTPPTPPTPPAMTDPAMASGRSSVDAKAVAQQILHQMRTSPAQPLPGGGGGHNPSSQPRTPDISVRSKYHDMSVEDMAFLNDRRRLVGVRSGYPYMPDVAFMRELTDKAKRSIKSGAIKSLDEATASRILAIKDNELDNTQTANQASDWVPTLWTGDLWRRVRVDNNIAASIRTIEMPSQSYELPVESTDPTVNKVPETTNESQLSLGSGNPIPDSVMASAKKTLTAVKLGLRVGFSTEMEEDSIIAWIPQLREQSMRAMLNAIDNVIVNGDTATGNATNINDIAGTPAATDKFLVFNGMRKLGLVTNLAGVGVNAGGASPTLQMIRQARFKMQSAGNVYALYPQNLVMFCDPYTYGKVLNIDEINVWMNNGRESTVNTGKVPLIDGVELYPSQEMVLANTAGKIDQDTAANNTTGTFVIAARMGWTLGYRRQITTSVDFLPYYDSYQFTATVRIALVNQDTVSAAVIYNIAV